MAYVDDVSTANQAIDAAAQALMQTWQAWDKAINTLVQHKRLTTNQRHDLESKSAEVNRALNALPAEKIAAIKDYLNRGVQELNELQATFPPSMRP